MIRDIATGLRPSVLNDLGLGAALEEQARKFSKRTSTPVSVSIQGGFGGVADRQQTYISWARRTTDRKRSDWLRSSTPARSPAAKRSSAR